MRRVPAQAVQSSRGERARTRRERKREAAGRPRTQLVREGASRASPAIQILLVGLKAGGKQMPGWPDPRPRNKEQETRDKCIDSRPLAPSALGTLAIQHH